MSDPTYARPPKRKAASGDQTPHIAPRFSSHAVAGPRHDLSKLKQAYAREDREAIDRHQQADAEVALQIAAEILRDGHSRLLASAPFEYVVALWTLKAAVTGRESGTKLAGAERLELLELGGALLRTAIHDYRPTEEGERWLEEQYNAPMLRKMAELEFVAANDRVQSSTLIDGRVYDSAHDDDPHAAAAALHAEIPKLLHALSQVNEWNLGYHELALHVAVTEELEKRLPAHRAIRTLQSVRNVLEGLDGLLLLSDDEFRQHVAHATIASFEGLRTYGELVKAVVEVAGAASAVTFQALKLAARARNWAGAAQLAEPFALAAKKASTVVMAIEIATNVLALFTAETREESVDAAVGIAQATSQTVIASRKAVETLPWLERAAPPLFALSMGYHEFKLAMELCGQASLGLTSGLMQVAFERLQMHAEAISREYEHVRIAAQLAAAERDPAQRDALERVLTRKADGLGVAIDGLIVDLEPPADVTGAARHPGAFPILREAFSEVLPFRGARSPEATSKAAAVAVQRLGWTFAHAQALACAATKNEHIDAAERYARDAKEEEPRE